jgi:hypothetical protein
VDSNIDIVAITGDTFVEQLCPAAEAESFNSRISLSKPPEVGECFPVKPNRVAEDETDVPA